MKNKECGLSLTELMVSIVVGAFVSLAATTFYVTTVGAGKSLFDSVRSSEQVNSILDTIARDMRRAGYRGEPTTLATYLVSTQGSSGVAGDEGDFPAVEVTKNGNADCVVYTFVTGYQCQSGDDANFSACASSGIGADVNLHHRFGFRLSANGVMEAVAEIHPTAYDLATSGRDSSCASSDGTWQPVTIASEMFVDQFDVSVVDETVFNADTGCAFDTDCDGDGADDHSNTAECGDTLSCRIERLYAITMCAYPETTDNQCVAAADGSQPDGQVLAEILVTPRNDVLIARVYP